jgi:IclR family acetate operon transcriptional repressor
MMTETDLKSREENTTIVPLGEGAPRGKRKIQSVERALAMLELLAEARGPRRLGDIAKTLGLNVSTCHHLLGTLLEHGYVAQSAQGRTYFLGNKILELSGSRMRQFNLADVVMDDLRALNESTGETVHLAVLQGDELVTLAVLDSHHAVRVVSGPGGKSNAIHATATGKAILAWLPETEIDRIVARRGLTKFTDNTITDYDALMDDMRHVRRNGFAVDNEEFQPGVICTGAAIRDYTGAVIGSFSCSMPTMRADKERIKAVQKAVRETAKNISKTLGGAVDSETAAAE